MSTPPTTRCKDKYKVKNWQAYNKKLCQRGSLTLWLNESVLHEWAMASKKNKNEKKKCTVFAMNNYK
jgi:hypothetical protein